MKGRRIMKYKTNIFVEYGIEIPWSTVYFGIDKEYIDLKSIASYATNYIEKNSNQDFEELLELAWETNDPLKIKNLLETLSRKYPKYFEISEKNDERRWRFCILKYLRETELEMETILNKICDIYADFNYPEDMRNFVKYMPSIDDEKPDDETPEGYLRLLMEKFDRFLEKEGSC